MTEQLPRDDLEWIFKHRAGLAMYLYYMTSISCTTSNFDIVSPPCLERELESNKPRFANLTPRSIGFDIGSSRQPADNQR